MRINKILMLKMIKKNENRDMNSIIKIRNVYKQLLFISASCLISFNLSAAVCEPEESLVFYGDNSLISNDTLTTGGGNTFQFQNRLQTPAFKTTTNPIRACRDHSKSYEEIITKSINLDFGGSVEQDPEQPRIVSDFRISRIAVELVVAPADLRVFNCIYDASYIFNPPGALGPELIVLNNDIWPMHGRIIREELPEVVERNLGPCEDFCATESNINPANGNVYEETVDMISPLPGRDLLFSHTYNSQADTEGRLGRNRIDNYDVGVTHYPETNSAIVRRPNGKEYTFFQDEDTGEWCSATDITDTLESENNIEGFITWTYTNSNDTIETYDEIGRLESTETKEGFVQRMDYGGASGDPTLLDTVRGTNGESLDFTYDADGRVETVTTPNDEVYRYSYDDNGNLEEVIYPDETVSNGDNPKKTYLYEDPDFPNALTGVIDENGENVSTYNYDDEGRAISSIEAEASNNISLVYNEDAEGNLTTTTVSTPDNGATQELFFDVVQGVRKLTDMGSDACVLCGGNVHNTTYDQNGFPSSRIDFNGNITLYEVNDRGLPECAIDASGQAETRMMKTEWHPDFRIPTEISIYAPEQGDSLTPVNCTAAENEWQHLKRTDANYNDNGQLTTTTDTDIQTGENRSMSFSYYGDTDGILKGLLKTVNGDRTDVLDITQYEYDPITANLNKITNALGHETRITEYDGNSRPTRIESPNGLVTTINYHPRGWIEDRVVDGQLTHYDYYPDGTLEKITLPNNASLTYTRDEARRVTDIVDNLGNRIHYELDTFGNATKQEFINDGAAIIGELEREYNVLNLLSLEIGGEGELTRYAYDNNGNLRAVTDPRNTGTDPVAANALNPFFTDNTAVSVYDALNRLISSTNIQVAETSPGSGVLDTSDDNVVTYKYDALDNLVEVTDPKGLKTTYNYNALGDLKSINSPDTGNMTYQYDSAGNRSKQIDARGVEVDFTYDALNRIKTVDYIDDSLDITYTYDNPAVNGIGRLTSMTDKTGTSSYVYDIRGNLESMTTVLDGNSYITSYNFNGANQVTSVTYPSGRQLTYSRDSVGRVTDITSTSNAATETIVNNITYAPFGPMTDYTFGNGVPMSRPLDKSYRLTELKHTGVYELTYNNFDAANNILSITNDLDNNLSQTFTYDGLQRLDVATGNYGSHDYNYDANGNRTSLIIDALTTTTYNYPADSHRIQDIVDAGTRTYEYDNNGNTTNNGIFGFVYGDHNRLEEVLNGASTVASYTYNGNGERVIKQINTNSTYFHYDIAGQLIAESDATGNIQREYIFLAGTPIAMTDVSVSGSDSTTVIDNNTCGFIESGDWTASTTISGFVGSDYLISTPGEGDKQLSWSCELKESGEYTINAQWPADASHASNAVYTINHVSGTDTITVNQQQAGGQYNPLGNYVLDENSTITLTNAANGTVVGDAIQLIKQANMPESLYFIHGDHLGTPHIITDSEQSIVWQANYDPYGNATITTESITNNLRFPGQYFDIETNLHYNYFRYYDPDTGRYITSDPIGLYGGMNTYGYAGTNPNSYIDPFGLSIYSKAVKLVFKKGDVAATFAGNLEDAATLANPAAPVTSRALAGLSILSEVLPVSARDVSDGYGWVKKTYEKCKITKKDKSKTLEEKPEITTAYKRPGGATTKEQRDSVQNQPCVDCGDISERQVADHKTPLVKEYYETGTIDKNKMHSLDAVQPQCPTCSAKQGAEMSRYSRQKKQELGL